MKKTLIAMLLVAAFAGNFCMAASTTEQVAKMAQKGSGTTFDALCVAVYEAVKAEPNNAVEIFKTVMMQRESWSATETYSVLRSGVQLLATLYTMPQTQPVAGVVAQGVAATTITGTSAGNGISSDSVQTYVPNAPATTPEEDFFVTPGDTSSNNFVLPINIPVNNTLTVA